ncbi:hypothetical protein EST38_g1775 [Candolleomyces aberdarensis]|uniref:Fungal-type protein kinase domain-containing protein n=1 Tax=Candolleomyces aberdarensis TaxID=2316362 RepID=A0A4Q2DW83_9AGAR|nr:hypothetical protein EST38_g1775 [Candolleomyces aberdarensis]
MLVEHQTLLRGAAGNTTTDDVVEYIKDELGMTPCVGLVPMLKALLVLQHQREVSLSASQSHVLEEGIQLHHISEEAKKNSEEQFYALLEAAVQYCNDPQRSASMKDSLRTSLSAKSELERCHPLIQALNTILLAFHDTNIGELHNGRDSLYVSNDPTILRSAPLSVAEDAPKARRYAIRKPDIVDPAKGHLKRLITENEHFTLAEWVDFIPHRQKEVNAAMKDAPMEKETTWDDSTHCWELKYREGLEEKDLLPFNHEYETAKILTDSGEYKATSSTPNLDVPSAVKPTKPFPRKEKENPGVSRIESPRSASGGHSSSSSTGGGSGGSSASGGSGSSSTGSSLGKRSRASPSVEPIGSKSIKDLDGNKKKTLSPDGQCTLYEIELLHSRWDRTHAIVILLEDNMLSLRWHDAQGYISTHPIDIVAQLPLLVVIILFFQRFGDRMRGNSGINLLEAEANGKKFKYVIPDDVHSGLELKGRRRVTATPLVERPPASAHSRYTRQNARAANAADCLPLDDDLFFKLSGWREHTRQSEGFVVQTAKERAVQLLGENAGDVLNHLPDIEHFENYPLFSTGYIRKCLGLGIGGARIPSSLLADRLAPLEEVEPDDFPLRMWEIIRCHYFLWQTGIAHVDISLWNLMVRTASDCATHFAVLNGFNLAAIMEPGQESPLKLGFERAGTKPFMALDLLSENDRSIKRMYFHDLEAMIWCMVWFWEPQPEWVSGSMRQVADNKAGASLLFKANNPPEWATDNEAEHLWTSVIRLLKVWIVSRPTTVEMVEVRQYFTDHDNLLLFHKHLPYPERQEKKDWDSRWMSRKLPVGDIITNTDWEDEGKN